MGKPVISGADPWTLAAMKREFGKLPFYAATEATLVDRLRKLVQSSTLRSEWGGRGVAHVRRYHDERPALADWPSCTPPPSATPGPTASRARATRRSTFANPQGRRIWLDAEADPPSAQGGITTDDPYIVGRLRSIAAKRPLWGITEERHERPRTSCGSCSSASASCRAKYPSVGRGP